MGAKGHIPKKTGTILDGIQEIKRDRDVNTILQSSAAASAICEVCGKEFKQDWSESKGRYSQFKICRPCHNRSRRKDRDYLYVEIPYEPHDGQKLVHESDKRFRLICLPPGEFISGADKTIERVTLKDRVFGNNCLLNNVHKLMNRQYKGFVYRINARYILPFKVTDEHPVLIAKAVDIRRQVIGHRSSRPRYH